MTSQRIKLIAGTAMAAFIAAIVLDRPALAQGAAGENIELPAYKGTLKDDYYPADARQHYLQGRALVEFALNGRGVPTDVVIVNSEPAHQFEDSARHLVQNLRFEVPPGWERSAAAAHRFRMGVRFQVIECINFSKCESQPRNPPADYEAVNRTYVVTTQRRVLVFDSNQPKLPGPPPGPPAAPPPPPTRDGPAASPEPIYPPG